MRGLFISPTAPVQILPNTPQQFSKFFQMLSSIVRIFLKICVNIEGSVEIRWTSLKLTIIEISSDPTNLTFEFEDLVRFHGTQSICGLTVSFKVMEAAWQKIWSDTPPKRNEITVASGFPGPGTRDGFEMVTRAVSRDAYSVIPDAKPGPLVCEAAKGAYFFQISDERQIIELGLKPGMLPSDCT